MGQRRRVTAANVATAANVGAAMSAANPARAAKSTTLALITMMALAPIVNGEEPRGSSPALHDGASYREWTLPNGSKAHLVEVDLHKPGWEFRPALASPTTAPTSETAAKHHAAAAVNGGYFNLKEGGLSTSFVTISGALVADPRKNKLLTSNPKLIPYLPQIFNRTEVRFVRTKDGKSSILFAKHNETLPKGVKLMHALQGGPRLLPAMDAAEEAFYRTDRDGAVTDAIGVKRPAARTAFGTTADGRAMMLTVSGKGQDPESSGITLQELADTLKELGCTQALNFDGGASSTMFVSGKLVCGKNPETRVKSVLMLQPTCSSKQD
jgi:hypothetical protein